MQPEDFAKNMAALWSKPRETADANLAIRQYIDALAKFTPAQLQAGWNKLREEHDRASWPLISDCRKAIMSASTVSNPGPPKRTGKEEFPDFANGSMRSDLARRAKSEGWLLGLWDFCNLQGRMPHSHEVGRLKTAADEANRLANDLDPTNSLHRVLINIWGLMRDRERKLAALVPEKVPA